jgi:hypothetical protein
MLLSKKCHLWRLGILKLLRCNSNKSVILLFVLLFSVLLVTGCADSIQELKVNETEILFDKTKVSDVTVQRLGAYLIESEFADGSPKTVELVKGNDTWQFKMVVQQDYIDDPDYLYIASVFAAQLSKDVFYNEVVEIHFCNSKLVTQRVVDAASGLSQVLIVGETEIFYNGQSVTAEDAESLGSYLQQIGFIDESAKSIALDKSGSIWQFRMVVQQGYLDEPDYEEVFQIFANDLSVDLFNGEPLEFHLCDELFVTLKVIYSN